MEKLWFAGSDPRLESKLREFAGDLVALGVPESLEQQQPVVLQGYGAMPAELGANAFSMCRQLKTRGRGPVFVAVADGDDGSVELARFCLADGALRWSGGDLEGLDRVRSQTEGHEPRVSLDALLAKLEDGLDDDAKRESAARRLAHRDREQGLLEKLTDVDTGLFDGPFASFKLDEEFKRSMRFHQPLSLLLLDIGVPHSQLPADEGDRKGLLAEVASVFLNECRDIDILARFTETVFLFLLPGTGGDGADTLTRRMLSSLSSRAFGPGVDLDPRAGLVSVPRTGIRDRKDLLNAAEACLALAMRGEGSDGLCSSWE